MATVMAVPPWKPGIRFIGLSSPAPSRHGAVADSVIIPTISTLVRIGIAAHAQWLQFVPAILGGIWAIGYFARHKTQWDWNRHGPLLLLVSVFVASDSRFDGSEERQPRWPCSLLRGGDRFLSLCWVLPFWTARRFCWSSSPSLRSRAHTSGRRLRALLAAGIPFRHQSDPGGQASSYRPEEGLPRARNSFHRDNQCGKKVCPPRGFDCVTAIQNRLIDILKKTVSNGADSRQTWRSWLRGRCTSTNWAFYQRQPDRRGRNVFDKLPQLGIGFVVLQFFSRPSSGDPTASGAKASINRSGGFWRKSARKRARKYVCIGPWVIS